MKFSLHILLFLSFLASVPSHAAEEKETSLDDIILEQPTSDIPKLSREETISVDFPDEELIVILRNVADLYKLNLVIPEELSSSGKRTSVRLRNLTWKQLFDVILAPAGYYWYREDNIVFIASYEYFSDRFADESITLQKIKFSDVQPIIEMLENDKLVRDVHYNSETKALSFKTRISLSFALTHIIQRMDQEALRIVEIKTNSNRVARSINAPRPHTTTHTGP